MLTVAGTFPDLESVRLAMRDGSAVGLPRLTVVAQTDGGSLKGMPGIRLLRAESGDGVQNRAETTTAGALLGLFVAGILTYAPGAYAYWRTLSETGPLQQAGATAARTFVEFPAVLVVAIFMAGAVVGAWLGRGFGLPRGLAYRYGLQLRRGRVLVSARVPNTDIARVAVWFQQSGASDVRVSDGRLRLRQGTQPDSLDLPAAAGR